MAENSFKVVRDRISEFIGLSGNEFAVKKLSDLNFLPEIENKLKEEIEEYLEHKEPEELADLLEIIYRIAELRGSSKDELEALRIRKREEKGGFEKNLILFNPVVDKDSIPELHSTYPGESTRIVFKPEGAETIEKRGVRMRIYTTKSDCRDAAVLYQETETGHAEEFMHETSNFIYYIIEGSDTWIIEDREYEVQVGDVVVVPAGKRFWFRGNLKQVCVTAPAWEERFEHHIRDIKL
jgi:predicted house-cleaning noncanonical NTP pyrophosphatase (MazG superfamily)/mannose-6-phosphate isomerase-like protein (cupin superfamily)